MAQSFLPVLALILGLPCSQAGEVSLGGAVGGQVLSDVLHKFFATREANRKAAPTWKPEVESMMSLVESMKNLEEVDPGVKANVTSMVTSIITLLSADLSRIKEAQVAAVQELANEKTEATRWVTEVATAHTTLKTDSISAQVCHDDVSQKKKDFIDVHSCSASDISSESCNCKVDNVFDFELVDEAKELRWCDFAASQTAQSCIDSLWVEVNKTRAALKSKHTKWLADKAACQAKKDKCAVCTPMWEQQEKDEAECKGRHAGIYETYRSFQTKETRMCAADTTLSGLWSNATVLQTSRTEEWSDLKFVICIFEDFESVFNFTQSSYDNCKDQFGTPEFYTFVGGQLEEPVLDLSTVPTCDRTRTSSSVTVEGLCPDQKGLCSLWEYDKCGSYTDVTINTGNTFNPVGTDMGNCS